jgi:heme iron utilization protein
LSRLAEHTQNLSHHEESSILLSAPPEAGRSPLATGRVTLLGPCRRIEDPERDEARRIYLAAQPDAEQYVDFKDFAFYRLEPVALRYVGGFGRMSWVSVDEYRAAEPDPLASSAPGILAHMNGDHADAVLAYARGLARILDATGATMTAMDRYGFELVVVTPSGPRSTRLGFDAPISSSNEVRGAMVALVQAARAALEK